MWFAMMKDLQPYFALWKLARTAEIAAPAH
jgi:hypothetical protein